MTANEMKWKLQQDAKKYMHVDYDDDADIIELMIDCVIEEMTELIPKFDVCNMTSRQKLLILTFTKELYDNREKYQKDTTKITNAVSSMLLKEIYGGASK